MSMNNGRSAMIAEALQKQREAALSELFAYCFKRYGDLRDVSLAIVEKGREGARGSDFLLAGKGSRSGRVKFWLTPQDTIRITDNRNKRSARWFNITIAQFAVLYWRRANQQEEDSKRRPRVKKEALF
jgi:hypothetical protein